HADAAAFEVLQGRDAGIATGHEALAVEEGRRRELEADAGVARAGPGGVADQHVDFAGLHRREALLGGEGTILDLVGVTEDSCGYCLAEVDVEAFELAFG